MIVATSASRSSGAIIATNTSNGSISFFSTNISGSDLINSGQATLGSATSTDAGTFPVSGAHDGLFSGNSNKAYWTDAANGADNLVTLTFTLAGSATGYDITSINTIYGWTTSRDWFTNQEYDILVATVSQPTYTLLHAVNYDPFASGGEGSSQVNLTDSTGKLATAVTGIRFLLYANGSFGETGVIHEIDVAGVATIPEPSAALLGLFGVGLLMRRRR